MAAQAMRDGAFGLSTGLFYVPGTYTPTEEVIEIAKVVGVALSRVSQIRQEIMVKLKASLEHLQRKSAPFTNSRGEQFEHA